MLSFHPITYLKMHKTWQNTLTHLPGRLTLPADSLARQTHLPGKLTCPADSFAWQTQLPGRLTCPADSLGRQTHLSEKLTCPADSIAWPHLPDATADDAALNQTTQVLYQKRYWMELCREACRDPDNLN